MPVKVSKVKGGFQVKTPNMVHAKHTTKKKAIAQQRLLNAIEHGFVPAKNKKPSDESYIKAHYARRKKTGLS